MKEHWKYIVISLLIGGFLGSALTMAGWHYARHGRMVRGFGHMREHLYKDLKLSPEQKKHIDTIMKTSREKIDAIRVAARQEIRKELFSSSQQHDFDDMNAKLDARREQWKQRIKRWHE